ncbi:MAG: EamA family transporter [Dehalococcoidia bacterium]
MLGIALSLVSAFWFASSNVLIRRGVSVASPGQGIFVTVVLGAVLFLVFALATGQIFRAGELAPIAYAWLAGAGISHFIVGRYGAYRSIQAMGANRLAPLQALSIPYSVGVAVLLLDEVVTPLMAVGITLIIVGPFVMVQRRRNSANPATAAPAASAPTPATGSRDFTPKLAEGYLWGAVSALGFGTSPLFIRAAIHDVPIGIFGGFVSYLAATALLLVLMSPLKRVQEMRSLDKPSLRFFLGAGTAVFLAQLFRYIALGVAPVSIVTPLLRMGDVFTVILSWIVNRRLESFSGRVILGVVISVSGAMLLAF